jgi:hypothetical protein
MDLYHRLTSDYIMSPSVFLDYLCGCWHVVSMLAVLL